METNVANELLELAPDWPALHHIWSTATSKSRPGWRLPHIAAEAMGKPVPEMIHARLAAVIGALQTGIMLVDDIIDRDPRGAHVELGPGEAANVSHGLIGLAYDLVLRLGLSEWRFIEATREISQMLHQTAYGQHLDGAGRPETLEAYWHVVRSKSTPFYAMAFALGGIVGGATLQQVVRLGDLGRLFGEIVQIKDDLTDAMGKKLTPDWADGPNLLILYGLLADYDQKEEFERLVADMADGQDTQQLPQAQQILINAGAVAYCYHELDMRQSRFADMLQKTKAPQPGLLLGVVQDAMEPLANLTA